VAEAPDDAPTTNGAAIEDLEAVVAMRPIGRRVVPRACRPIKPAEWQEGRQRSRPSLVPRTARGLPRCVIVSGSGR
jgi:hypothetical protein